MGLHQTHECSTMISQLVLELTGVRCLTIPPGQLHPPCSPTPRTASALTHTCTPTPPMPPVTRTVRTSTSVHTPPKKSRVRLHWRLKLNAQSAPNAGEQSMPANAPEPHTTPYLSLGSNYTPRARYTPFLCITQ